jgi:stearoyl-CoA desaturase (delta-9 desaturase)
MTTIASPPRYGIQPGEAAWFSTLRVLERHLGVLVAVCFVPLNWPLFWLALLSFCIRMFGIEGINHRYFSHRSYKASRAVQFILALIALQAGQRGSLWWASKHRDHHKYAETDRDPHSPANHRFFEAYVLWFRRPQNALCNLDDVADFARYPELRWLDRNYLVPFYGGAVLLFLVCHFGWLGPNIDGISGLLWGFYFPCFLVLHATSMINTLAHMPWLPGGYRRYEVKDHSVNRPTLALLTLGGGFHNNHHRQGTLARAGFAWYEFDISYYILLGMQALGIISEVKGKVPDAILIEGHIKPRDTPK